MSTLCALSFWLMQSQAHKITNDEPIKMEACSIVRDNVDFNETYIALFNITVQKYIYLLKNKEKRNSKSKAAPEFEIVFEKINKIYFCLNGKIMGKDESAVNVEYDFDGLALIDGENARTFWQEYYQKDQDVTVKFRVVDGVLNQEKFSDSEKEFLVQINYEDEYFDMLGLLYIERINFPTLFSKKSKFFNYPDMKKKAYLYKNMKKKAYPYKNKKELEELDEELLLEIEKENKIKRDLKFREDRKAKIRNNLPSNKLLPSKKLKNSELNQPVNFFEDAKNKLINYVKELMNKRHSINTTDIMYDFLSLEASSDKRKKIVGILVEAGVKEPKKVGRRPIKKDQQEYDRFVDSYQKFPQETLNILIQNNKKTPK